MKSKKKARNPKKQQLKLSNVIKLRGDNGPIVISRLQDGIPMVEAKSQVDAMYGQGWVHANDRQLHFFLTRIVMQGRASELLAADPALIELDKYIRRMRFFPDIEKELKKLKPKTLEMITAYTAGINDYINANGYVFEFKLLGIKPEPWDIRDTMLQAKAFTYLGLSYAQTDMEKLIIQLIQNGLDEKRLKELYPYLTDKYDAELIKKVTLSEPLIPEAIKWLELIPRFTASNNWAVSGKKTVTGRPILCGDPHLEVNRLPSVWHEIALSWPDNKLIGAGLPGAPGVLIGRNRNVSWSATYSFMDMIDFRIEECAEGKYRRSTQWEDFQKTTEIIRLKKPKKINGEKTSAIKIDIYENEHGVLEGDPNQSGYYLAGNWSARYNAGANDLNGIIELQTARSVRDAMTCFRKFEVSTYNWAIADSTGNIGYQMSGRAFHRAPGFSGLIPQPGWINKFDHLGFIPANLLPALYNPADGIIVTANEDLNYLGQAKPINLPMASYRSDRIRQLLLTENENNPTDKSKLDVNYMQKMHYNLYSLQAKNFMEIISPYLPETEAGNRLRQWNFEYDADSDLPTMFENIYIALLKNLFGDQGIGRDAIEYLMKETGIFNDYYGNFDNIFFNEKSSWFTTKSRAEIIHNAINEGLAQKAKPFGKTRKFIFRHILFGGKFPRFFGFDRGPIVLSGSRATIPQGQLFRSGGRWTSFAPSLRFVADMQNGDFYVNISGGISDRRFSKLYFNRTSNWLKGIYTKISIQK